MSKTLNMAAADLHTQVVQAVNASGVPLILVEYILRDVLHQVQALNTSQLAKDRQECSQPPEEPEEMKTS